MFKQLLACALIVSSAILGGCVYGDGETEEDSGTVVTAESVVIETEGADELTVDPDKITCKDCTCQGESCTCRECVIE